MQTEEHLYEISTFCTVLNTTWDGNHCFKSFWNEYWNGLNAHSVCANFELKLDLNAKSPNQDEMTHRQVYVSS